MVHSVQFAFYYSALNLWNLTDCNLYLQSRGTSVSYKLNLVSKPSIMLFEYFHGREALQNETMDKRSFSLQKFPTERQYC